MSRAVIEMLARRWGCSVEDVGRRIGARLEAAGLADPETTRTIVQRGEIDAHLEKHGGPAFWHTLGITDDDRIFVLDEDDHPLLEL